MRITNTWFYGHQVNGEISIKKTHIQKKMCKRTHTFKQTDNQRKKQKNK